MPPTFIDINDTPTFYGLTQVTQYLMTHNNDFRQMTIAQMDRLARKCDPDKYPNVNAFYVHNELLVQQAQIKLLEGLDPRSFGEFELMTGPQPDRRHIKTQSPEKIEDLALLLNFMDNNFWQPGNVQPNLLSVLAYLHLKYVDFRVQEQNTQLTKLLASNVPQKEFAKAYSTDGRIKIEVTAAQVSVSVRGEHSKLLEQYIIMAIEFGFDPTPMVA